MTKRLIEEWLLIAELVEESKREGRSMMALPPICHLLCGGHVVLRGLSGGGVGFTAPC